MFSVLSLGLTPRERALSLFRPSAVAIVTFLNQL